MRLKPPLDMLESGACSRSSAAAITESCRRPSSIPAREDEAVEDDGAASREIWTGMDWSGSARRQVEDVVGGGRGYIPRREGKAPEGGGGGLNGAIWKQQHSE